MRKSRYRIPLLLAAAWVVLLSCTLSNANVIATQVAGTLTAESADTEEEAPMEVTATFTVVVGEPADVGQEPTFTITPTATSSIPMLTVSVNTNCREGPGTGYELLGALLVGETAEVVGRPASGSSNYLIIKNPDGPENCWVWLEHATVTGDLSGLPYITPPPLATDTPTPIPFGIIDADASVDDSFFSGVCPHKFTFTTIIYVTAPGTVTYKWLRSDGANAPEMTITFDAAGHKSVTTTWTFGGAGNTYTDYWQRLEILSPEHRLSNKAKFTLDCP